MKKSQLTAALVAAFSSGATAQGAVTIGLAFVGLKGSLGAITLGPFTAGLAGTSANLLPPGGSGVATA